MRIINSYKDIILALSISTLLYGVFLFLTKHYIIGGFTTVFSSICIYYFYIMSMKTGIEESSKREINIFNVRLGFMLIFIDIIFNLVVRDGFGNFDISLILCGVGIVLLNMGMLKFLKFDQFFVDFMSRFLFIFILSYGFLHTGIRYLTGSSSENYLLTSLTLLSGKVSCFFLNFIGPTTISIISDPWSHGMLIDFKSFTVGIFSACSGAESITLFMSAVVAYIFSVKNVNIKKMVICTLIGLIFLFFINVFRIILLILIGYEFGTEALNFFHYNLGWVFFIISMSVFWLLVIRNE